MGVENLSGQYVRAVYPFDTSHPREINLSKGDIIRVVNVIDDNWYCGELRGQKGNFPSSFVETLSLAAVEEGQKLYGAIENFPAQQDGDLEFRKGAVILGTQQIDANWWQGQIGNSVGIFPITHVMELEIPPSLKERSQSLRSAEPLFALALCDSVAQLDEELGFKTGDIITVTEIIDSDWYYGELGRKKGMFLSSCVELIQDTSQDNGSLPPPPSNAKPTSKVQKSFSLDQSYYGSVSDPKPKEVPSNSTEIHQVSDHQYQTELPDQSANFTSENTKSLDSCVSPYAMTLYPFEGQSDNELSFDANEIVYLIQHINDQWTEGEIDGRMGLFPTCFVSIIVDCPYAFQDTVNPEEFNAPKEDDRIGYQELEMTEEKRHQDLDINENRNSSHTSVTLDDVEKTQETNFRSITSEESVYALVLYTFTAESEQDLGVNEGDTVQVIEHVNAEWVRAREETSGRTGLIPAAFLDIIGDNSSHFMEEDKRHVEDKPLVKDISHNKTDQTSHQEQVVHLDKTKSRRMDVQQDKTSVNASVPKDMNKGTCHSETLYSDDYSEKRGGSSSHSFNFTLEQKPVLPVKPLLNPKPVMKPKPSLSPKPLLPDRMKLQTVKELCDNEATLLKSSSAQVLSQGETNSALQKSYSNSELSSATTDKSQNRRATFTFGEVDTSKSLNDLISTELSKAKQDKGPGDVEHQMISKPPPPVQAIFPSEQESGQSFGGSAVMKKDHNLKRHSVNFPIHHQTGQTFTENDDFKGNFSEGNSIFFLDPIPANKNHPPMRKPPPIPQRSFDQSIDFNRRPSLRKAPPPRPTGPRIASGPSTQPLVPMRVTEASKDTQQEGQVPRVRPSRPAPTCPIPLRTAPTRPAPTRPAPSRPQGPPPSLVTPQKELITLEDPVKVESHDVIVTDLRKKIKDLEMDIEKFEKERADLEKSLVENEENEETKESIQFYTENISGLKSELSNLKKDLVVHCPEEGDLEAQREAERKRKEAEVLQREEERKRNEEMKVKRREKRGKVIEELIQTEKDFQHSLGLCIETFLSPGAERHPDVDMSVLMGNIEDVADMSQRLLTALEGAVQGKDFEEQVIGVRFVILAEDMKTAFAPYCRNHDQVITLLEKYEENESIMEYINRMLEKMRQKTVIFDLGALLIKPVQRILKYPLLLNELYKSTEDDHPDKKDILNAINCMTDVASTINEYKRRTDLVFKYKKVSDESIGDKLAKLSFHTIKKKGSRFKGRISTNLGLSLIKDESFDREENKFRQLEKMVKVFVRNTQSYMDQLQESVTCHECMVADLADFYDDKQSNAEMQKYREAQEDLDRKHLPLFQESVRDMVTSPLNTLLTLFVAPNKVIQKRFDKMLDYDSMQRKVTDGRMPEKALQSVKNDYEGLNAQLLDELPKLYSLSIQLLQGCIAAFVQAQREYVNQRSIQLSDTLDKVIQHEIETKSQSPNISTLPSLLSSSDNLIDTFNIRHVAVVDKMSWLSFIPKGFNPKVDALKQPDKKGKRPSLVEETSSSQSQSQRVYLQQKFTADKLYKVSQSYLATDLMDLSLNSGDLVGVIQEKDPMGNRDRWFVDNGAAKGFIPSRLLQPSQSSEAVVSEEANQIYPNIPVPTSPLSPTVIGLRPKTNSSVSPSSQGSSPGGHGSFVDGSLTSADKSPKSQTLLSRQSYSRELDEFLDEDMTPDISSVEEGVRYECEEFYYAEYPFQSRAANEVSLFEGQVVTVYVKHDKEGNSEWWYVDADGVKGYVPSNYLSPMS